MNKIRVNILHESYYHRNGDGFLFPLKYNYRRLSERAISLNFYTNIIPSLLECDVLCISNRFFSSWWKDSSEAIIEFLIRAKKSCSKIIWFDISDSTGTTQFKVLPYVDRYVKNQILKDKKTYQRTYYGSRIFTDVYHRRFGIEDLNPGDPELNELPNDNDLHKIKVGWNSGMAHYGYYGHFGIMLGKIWHKIDMLPRFYPRQWRVPSSNRTILCSCRIGERYHRETISNSRKKIKDLLSNKIPVDKISSRKYFKELNLSIAAFSPFGLGEISCRDFEIVICGAAMIKQNMNHLETWPNLWIENKTYLPFEWDFSDFEEKIDFIFSNPEKMVELANHAQRIYKNVLCTEEGNQEFCNRFAQITQ